MMRKSRNRYAVPRWATLSALLLASTVAGTVVGGGSAIVDAGVAHAQPSDKDKKAAIKAFTEAKAKFEANDFEGALPLYQKADELYPGSRPKYQIALCLDQLGRTEEAIAAYKAFLDTKPDDEKYGDEKKAANKRIADLQAALPAKVSVKVAPEGVAGVAITVDGQPATGPTMDLPAGEHTIVVTAEGYQPATEVVSVAGGETRELAITLTPAATPTPTPTPPPPPVEDDDGGSSNIPAYVTLGIAGAGTVLGVVFGVQALSAQSDFEEMPTVDNADAAERNALIADMSFGVALTFGITGAVLLFSNSGGDDEEASEEASVVPEITPYAGTQGGGVGAKWTF